jgi:hypothetical protein
VQGDLGEGGNHGRIGGVAPLLQGFKARMDSQSLSYADYHPCPACPQVVDPKFDLALPFNPT